MDTELRAIGLTPAETLTLAMWAWDCLEPTEIASELGITPRAVNKRLGNARRKVADAGLAVRRMVADDSADVHSLDSYDIDNIDPRRVRAII